MSFEDLQESYEFLSTLPARGATGGLADGAHDAQFLSTLPARGATWRGTWTRWRNPISIHAPREGSDWPKGVRPQGRFHFYPRSPRGERPVGPKARNHAY